MSTMYTVYAQYVHARAVRNVLGDGRWKDAELAWG